MQVCVLWGHDRPAPFQTVHHGNAGNGKKAGRQGIAASQNVQFGARRAKSTDELSGMYRPFGHADAQLSLRNSDEVGSALLIEATHQIATLSLPEDEHTFVSDQMDNRDK